MTATNPSSPQSPKLLDRVADMLRTRGYVPALRQAYVDWARRFVLFHKIRHPQEMGAAEVTAFLDHLAAQPDLHPAAEVEARAALVFLYEVVLAQPLGELATAAGRQAQHATGRLAPSPATDGPRFLDQVRHVLRVRHYALRTEECYVDWARRFILFNGKRHPADLGTAHVEQFLTHLAVQGRVAVSTQMQALNALVFLYKQVLHMDLGTLQHVRASRPVRLPVVASREEIRLVLAAIQVADGLFRLAVELL